jgi:hypothetical protein
MGLHVLRMATTPSLTADERGRIDALPKPNPASREAAKVRLRKAKARTFGEVVDGLEPAWMRDGDTLASLVGSGLPRLA